MNILVVSEEGRATRKGRYLMDDLRLLWEAQGHRFTDVECAPPWPQADGVFLHVDLSVVPATYGKAAKSYPFQWNHAALDIRKRAVCDSLIDWSERARHHGPVLVKTDLNHAGRPEHRLALQGKHTPRRRLSKSDYRIHPSGSAVRPDPLNPEEWIIQPFRPELREGEYCLREYYFLGAMEYVTLEVSPDPIFTSGRRIQNDVPWVHPELRALDYGKIDYVLHEGRPFVLDANKTIASSRDQSTEQIHLTQTLAQGLIPANL
jgi:hypothetical protein